MKASAPKYSYAKDRKGDIVHIDNARQGILYRCLQCGNEMIPKKGDINIHHFAHKIECVCNGESYLHKLAKLKFKEIYDRSAEFILEYRSPAKCPLDKSFYSCPFIIPDCNTLDPHVRKLDLKKIFDQCLIEFPVDNGRFFADILLKDSSGKITKPMMIEFYHTHKCEPEKINSGWPIVEIKIKDEEDIVASNIIPYSGRVSLYGFKPVPSRGKELYYVGFGDYSDASDLTIAKLNCVDHSQLLERFQHCKFIVAIEPESYREFSEHPRFKRNPPTLGQIGCAAAYNYGFKDFENCDMCLFSRRSKFKEDELWCTRSKEYPDVPKNPKSSDAVFCRHSFPNDKRTLFIARHLKDLKYKVVRHF